MLKSTLLAICWVITTVALLMTVARLVFGYRQRVKLSTDDAFASAGAILLVILCICHTFMASTIYTLSAIKDGEIIMPAVDLDSMIVRMLKIQFSAYLVFCCCLWSAKLSLMFFIKRVMKGLPNLILIWHIILTFILVNLVGSIISTFLVCENFKSNFIVGPGNCTNLPGGMTRIKVVLYVLTAADVVTDLSIMILPIYIIWILRVNLKQKLGLAFMFCLGITCIVISIVRAYKFFEPESVHNPGWLVLWTQVLSAVAVMISCLPVIEIAARRPRSSTSGFHIHKPSFQASTCSYSQGSSHRIIPLNVSPMEHIPSRNQGNRVEIIHMKTQSFFEALERKYEYEEQQQLEYEQK